jgi:hypothetical protein
MACHQGNCVTLNLTLSHSQAGFYCHNMASAFSYLENILSQEQSMICTYFYVNQFTIQLQYKKLF